ncbi:MULTISPECIES: YqiA/YcfP family alpha/beta fold hydrolase [Pseudoxanthomonas]|uniref:Alpha/beta-hydrolase family hydrolase n=1 Tax=Pseudoxanthomonas winnipegensis TaxID=2480810 RepID=A0AAW8GAW2_9GAMM|nr:MULTISPECIES: YqiA/YcfP family alpha/beta fold hydrolase [Pseudoxanthomonas]MDQ1118338.1 putative alpha/beta-hydrolase family hydrolase [Pseudoxanthomonas winnipegensis]MDQ1131520.1 putative alpha/beta-hydrolase family hydrolase [Pseudoxanthomonas winnipegensis]MDR6138463.1 putative alpha/beta-hydrolase family hydrolase [Pseudoxanthomonas sp. SORGH_AS_0997]
MIRGHVILSHGFESGPDATKVTALAQVAQAAGWTSERPDFTDLDARSDLSQLGDVGARLARLRTLAEAAARKGPLVLVGSSLGAYTSAQVSLQVPVHGLFLMAPPTALGPMPALDAAQVPLSVIHGWDDELIPARNVIDWAQARRARLLLVNDDHRLANHVEAAATAFGELLAGL